MRPTFSRLNRLLDGFAPHISAVVYPAFRVSSPSSRAPHRPFDSGSSTLPDAELTYCHGSGHKQQTRQPNPERFTKQDPKTDRRKKHVPVQRGHDNRTEGKEIPGRIKG